MKSPKFSPSLFRSQAFPCAITLSLLAAGYAAAADSTWTGGTATTWATATNWSGSIVPGGSAANSDKASFNSAAYTFAPTAAGSYFIGGLIFGSSNGAITITTGTANNRLNVGPHGIQVDASSGAVSIGASSAGTQGASIVANQNWTNNSSSLLTVNRVSVDDASLAGTYTLTINGSGSGGVNFLNVIGDVNNALDATRLFALQINSTGGNTTISSPNTFTGGTTLSQGNLLLGNNTALGTGSLTLNGGKISSSATGSQAPTNNTTIGGNLTLGDAVNNGKLTFSGTMSLGGATRTLTTESLVEFSGGVGGDGGITKQGASTLTLNGASANTYSGLTTVSAGSLTLNKTAADAIAGNVLVNGTGTLTLGAADQIKNASNVEVAAGTFAMGSNSDTVNNLKLTGGAITGTGTSGILTSITAYDLQSGSSSAVLAGTVGATKTSAGTVTLNKANTYSGGTTLSAGTLQLGVASVGSVGSITSSAIGTGSLALNGGKLSSATANNRTVFNTTTIGGNVTLGDATNNGTLTFDTTVGLGAATHTLTTASNVVFAGVVSNGNIDKDGAGTLALNANSSTVAVTVNSGTLAGTGTAGVTSIATGNLAIGAIGGLGTMNFSSLTLGGASTFIYQMTGGLAPGAGSADLGDIVGNLALGGTLDLVELGTYTAGNKFTLFAYDGALSGNFTGLANEDIFQDDLLNSWQIKYDDGTAGLNGGAGTSFVTVTAIPEPGAALLGGLGMLALLRLRRCA